mmetsp:Transcript_1696/g.2194  ORF Transcript_1696/g.2194 Transcript_1696/m.2194 type:complete len:121 (+) Transcript_1696:417-779(+)
MSPKIGQLEQLKKLKVNHNEIEKIPESIGNCEELEYLSIQGNRFASFPCSFIKFSNLKELSLEWFTFAQPMKNETISRKTPEGTKDIESLMVLCNLLIKHKMKECALITFLENYSEENYD